MATAKALKLNDADNVAVCTVAVRAGDTVEVKHPDGTRSPVLATEDIAYCNKIALETIPRSAAVRKYGEVIGRATRDIAPGALVNDANIASQPRAYADEYLLGRN